MVLYRTCHLGYFDVKPWEDLRDCEREVWRLMAKAAYRKVRNVVGWTAERDAA